MQFWKVSLLMLTHRVMGNLPNTTQIKADKYGNIARDLNAVGGTIVYASTVGSITALKTLVGLAGVAFSSAAMNDFAATVAAINMSN